MKAGFIVFSALLVLASAKSLTEFHPIVAEVNSRRTTWQAEVPTRFGDLDDVRATCGTWMKGHPKHVDVGLPRHPLDVKPLQDLPSDFDSRTAWPQCDVIRKVRDQSECGSCWAFGSTEAFEDRRCVATNKSVEFSTEDTAGCCKGLFCGMSQGCGGGQPSAALHWMTTTGVVTGGDYFDIGNGTSCKPYLLHPCAHHVPPSSKYPACQGDTGSMQCHKKCSESKYANSYDQDKTKGSKAMGFSDVQGMMSSIMTEGPLAVAFTVYADFPTYKSGVYQHVSGQALGGHAVEMIGWGTMNGTDYWWIKNSWNSAWGDQGYFKIKRGNDECGIESDVTGITF